MDWDETIHAELGRADQQARGRDVVEAQRQRLGDAQTGRNEKREERDESPRPQRVCCAQRGGGAQQLVYLSRREYVGPWPSARRPEREIRRELVTGILDGHRPREAPNDLQPVAAGARRGCFTRPGHGAFGGHMILAARRRVAQKVLE
jgi:hypothetical protein